MARSFLDLITTDGRLCRLAEFGFFADAPSFNNGGIVFRTADGYRRFDLDTGAITAVEAPLVEKSGAPITSPSGRYTVSLEFGSKITNGRGYAHLMLRDNEKSTETVLTKISTTRYGSLSRLRRQLPRGGRLGKSSPLTQ